MRWATCGYLWHANNLFYLFTNFFNFRLPHTIRSIHLLHVRTLLPWSSLRLLWSSRLSFPHFPLFPWFFFQYFVILVFLSCLDRLQSSSFLLFPVLPYLFLITPDYSQLFLIIPDYSWLFLIIPVLPQVVDLIPGGRNVPVTDENKAEYIRLVAHHRMTAAIRSQVRTSLRYMGVCVWLSFSSSFIILWTIPS